MTKNCIRLALYDPLTPSAVLEFTGPTLPKTENSLRYFRGVIAHFNRFAGPDDDVTDSLGIFEVEADEYLATLGVDEPFTRGVSIDDDDNAA